MAGVSVFFLLLGCTVAAAVLSAAPIIIGTVLIRKTKYRVLGTAIRIFGYILTIPLVVIGAIFWIVLLF